VAVTVGGVDGAHDPRCGPVRVHGPVGDRTAVRVGLVLRPRDKVYGVGQVRGGEGGDRRGAGAFPRGRFAPAQVHECILPRPGAARAAGSAHRAARLPFPAGVVVVTPLAGNGLHDHIGHVPAGYA
jgi:hypothetical protein